jgi:Chloroplast envelope transporter
VEEAMDVGFQRFQPQDRDRVRSIRQDVRLEPSQALQILDATARKRMLTFVTKARSQRTKLDGAKELKNMVYFSNIVVAPLVYDIKVGVIRLRSSVQDFAWQ